MPGMLQLTMCKCSTPALSVSNRLAIVLFRAQRLQLGSPCASISLLLPRSSPVNNFLHCGSARILSAARLKYAVLLSVEKTSNQRTVATAPVRPIPSNTMPRLKDCCVVRAAFSPSDRSFHGTAPVSLTTVTDRRRGEASFGKEEVVAWRDCCALLTAAERNAGWQIGIKGSCLLTGSLGSRSIIIVVGHTSRE